MVLIQTLFFSDGIESEVSLYHKDDLNWIINLDETQHKFSTEGHRGGSTTERLINPSLPRSGDRITKGSRHTTGCYGCTAAGDPLPPLYILDTKSKTEENYSISPSVCEGLPVVQGKWGLAERTYISSFIAMRPKGSMDTSLWEFLFDTVILPLYPQVQKTIVRCPLTGRMIKGPLVIKTDAGPGRLAKEFDSFKFRQRMADCGVIILLGLPNGTAATQEMDKVTLDTSPLAFDPQELLLLLKCLSVLRLVKKLEKRREV